MGGARFPRKGRSGGSGVFLPPPGQGSGRPLGRRRRRRPVSAVRSMVWDPPVLRLLDQRQLPARVEELVCRTPEEVGEAIRSLAVRGAPAIGMAAAFGLVLGARRIGKTDPDRF